ncbi:hypothetical protein [Subtercola sp. YIM 133946]|uniref:hypothetical protein n=1 Tax=Subtercola sp. YIM 133946 TaxID=3118909 RepID=UPI002F920CB7
MSPPGRIAECGHTTIISATISPNTGAAVPSWRDTKNRSRLQLSGNPESPPGGHPQGAHYRLHYDVVDTFGKLTLCCAGTLHHLGVGHEHARTPVMILATEHDVTIAHQSIGEILGTYTIQRDTNYWRDQKKKPGRWPSS